MELNNHNISNSSANFITSPDASTEDIVTPTPTILSREKMKQRGSLENNYNHQLCCKMSIFFAACCLIVCYLTPVILYYVSQIGNDHELDPKHSSGDNTSNRNVGTKLHMNV